MGLCAHQHSFPAHGLDLESTRHRNAHGNPSKTCELYHSNALIKQLEDLYVSVFAIKYSIATGRLHPVNTVNVNRKGIEMYTCHVHDQQ